MSLYMKSGVMGMAYNRSQHPDKKQCIRLLHEAVDRDLTLFDTAIIYGPLTNEGLTGEALFGYLLGAGHRFHSIQSDQPGLSGWLLNP